MKKYSFGEIMSVVKDKGYSFFTKGQYNLNFIGIRSENSISDKFDDHYHIIYRGSDDRFKHYCLDFTSDPGKHWLLNPMNPRGTAILVPYQYRGVYSLGVHGRSWSSGGYEALEQVKPMMYVRDNSKNTKLDFDLYRDPYKRKRNVFWDNIKSNTHRASRLKKVLNVGKYSAGCQVIQDINDFEKILIPLCRKAKKIWGGVFSYTLLEENDF